MRHTIIWAIAVLLCGQYGCQRNTNELPTTNLTFTKTIYASVNDAKIDAYFTQHVGKTPYTLTVHFKAKPGVSLTNARVLIQYRTDDKSEFTTVTFPTVININSLNSTTSSAETEVNINAPFPINQDRLSAFLIGDSLSDITHPFSGYYNGLVIDSTITYTTDTNQNTIIATAILAQSEVKGYIDIGGQTSLLIKTPAQNVTGTLYDNVTFLSGVLTKKDTNSNINYGINAYNLNGNNLTFKLTVTAASGDTAVHNLTFNLNR